MLKNKYDLVLLDLDGTTADTDEVIVQSLYVLYDLYRDGKRSPREKVVYFSGPPIRGSLMGEFPDMDPDFMVEEFKRVSWDMYDKYAKTFPGVLETLSLLRDREIHLGVVTSKLHKQTEHCMKVIGLTDIVPYFIAGDDVTNLKPNPEGIYRAMEDFDIKNKNRVLYVGDNYSDYMTSVNAGVDCAMVKWGPRVIKEEIHPKYYLENFKDLEEIIYD